MQTTDGPHSHFPAYWGLQQEGSLQQIRITKCVFNFNRFIITGSLSPIPSQLLPPLPWSLSIWSSSGSDLQQSCSYVCNSLSSLATSKYHLQSSATCVLIFSSSLFKIIQVFILLLHLVIFFIKTNSIPNYNKHQKHKCLAMLTSWQKEDAGRTEGRIYHLITHNTCTDSWKSATLSVKTFINLQLSMKSAASLIYHSSSHAGAATNALLLSPPHAASTISFQNQSDLLQGAPGFLDIPPTVSGSVRHKTLCSCPFCSDLRKISKLQFPFILISSYRLYNWA